MKELKIYFFGVFHINYGMSSHAVFCPQLHNCGLKFQTQQKDATSDNMRTATCCAHRKHLHVVISKSAYQMPRVIRKRMLFLCMLRHDYLM